MCYNPLKIKNPRKFVRGHVDPPYIFVPCGHCEECRQQKINDWFVRLNYEFLDNKKNGGWTYFLTLTYCEDCLPLISTSQFRELYELFDVPYNEVKSTCFNKKQVSQFIQDLRDIIREKYGVSGVKFFVVCEYGKDPDGTHRPHYHLIIFCPAQLPPSVLRSLANYCWSERVKYDDVPSSIIQQSLLPAVNDSLKRGNYQVLQSWIIAPPVSPRHKKFLYKRRYGFTSWSRRGAVIKSSAALKYVLKYVNKDSEFMSSELAVELDNLIKHFPTLEQLESIYPPCDPLGNPDKNYKSHIEKGDDFFTTNPDFVRIHNLMQSVRDCYPFHLSSKNLGVSLIRQISDDWEVGKEFLKKNEIIFPSDQYVYRIPQYVIRRLFYNVGYEQQNLHYVKYRNYVVLNDLGKECLLDFFDYKESLFKRSFHMYISPNYVSMMSKEFVMNWYNKFGISFNQSISKLRNLSDNQVKLLFYYRYLFQGLVCLYKDADVLQYDANFIMKIAHDLFAVKVLTQDCRKPEHNEIYIDVLSAYHVPVSCTDIIGCHGVVGVLPYSDFEVFKEFDDYLFWIFEIKRGVKEFSCDSKSEKNERNNVLRSIYNRFIYNQKFS